VTEFNGTLLFRYPFQAFEAEPFPVAPIVHPSQEVFGKSGPENDSFGEAIPSSPNRKTKKGRTINDAFKGPKMFALYIFSPSLSRFFSRF
jgi:hypothetical protein